MITNHRLWPSSYIALLLVSGTAWAQQPVLPDSAFGVRRLVTSPACRPYDLSRPHSDRGMRTTQASPEVLVTCLVELQECYDDVIAKTAANEVSVSKCGDTLSVTGGAGRSPGGGSNPSMQPGAAARIENLFHDRVLSIYLTYKSLELWNGILEDRELHTPPSDPDSKRQVLLEGLQNSLEQTMKSHDIQRAFSAQLFAGFSFTATGAQIATTAATQGSQVDTQNAQPTAYIVLESAHTGWPYQGGKRADVSLSGTIGFRPTLTLVMLPDSSDSTGKKKVGPFAAFQQAFVWDTGFNVHWKGGLRAEHGPFVRYGQTILTSVNTLTGGESSPAIGTPLDNHTGRAEGKADVGYRFSYFSDSLDSIHTDRSVLAPMYSFAVGLRQDARFRGEGVPLEDFKWPKMRVVYSFGVDALQVFTAGDSSTKPFSLTLQVDYETALAAASAGTVPAGTRVFVQGSTDILKAFKGSK